MGLEFARFCKTAVRISTAFAKGCCTTGDITLNVQHNYNFLIVVLQPCIMVGNLLQLCYWVYFSLTNLLDKWLTSVSSPTWSLNYPFPSLPLPTPLYTVGVHTYTVKIAMVMKPPRWRFPVLYHCTGVCLNIETFTVVKQAPATWIGMCKLLWEIDVIHKNM